MLQNSFRQSGFEGACFEEKAVLGPPYSGPPKERLLGLVRRPQPLFGGACLAFVRLK